MYKLIGCGEYNSYYVDDQGVLKYNQNTDALFRCFSKPVRAIGTGLQNAAVVCEDNSVALIFPDGSIRPVAITDATTSISGFHNLNPAFDIYAVTCKDGIKCFDEQGNVVTLLNPTGAKFVKVVASWRLTVLDDQGGVWEYYWVTGGQLMTIQQLAFPLPNKVFLSGKATDICASRSQFSVAIVNGKPYGWCGGFGSGFIGLDFQRVVTNPIDLSAVWKLPGDIDQIIANDNTVRVILKDGRHFAMGNNMQGEVGNGEESPIVKQSGGWDLATYSFWVRQMVDVSNGRTYKQLSTGNFMVYYTYAQLADGRWTSCGGRPKGLVLGNGIRKTDDTNINLLDVPTFRIVDIPIQGKRVDEVWIKTAGNYPPAEPVAVATPPTTGTTPAIRKLKNIINVYDNGEVEVKQP